MKKVKFLFDKEKDLRNHWHKSNWKSSWNDFKVSPKTKEICENRKYEECKKELAKFMENIQESPFIDIHIRSVEKAWRVIEKEFFKRMNKLMKQKYPEDITAYLTTVGICPYDPKEPSYMFSFFYSLTKCLQTSGHEIMHLYFHKFYWDKVESKIGEEKTADLKEALTVLLNLEFKDLWFVEDFGYDSHKELRKFIVKEWKKKKDFDILIEKCIRYLK